MDWFEFVVTIIQLCMAIGLIIGSFILVTKIWAIKSPHTFLWVFDSQYRKEHTWKEKDE